MLIKYIYVMLNIQAQINETDIIFRVRAPIFEPTIYQLYHVIPIPINGHTFVSNTKLCSN